MLTGIQIALNTPGAWASLCTLAQLVPLQMSEPWHVSKPARQVHVARLDGRRGDRRAQGGRRGQRTVASVAFTVRRRGPSAERLGLRYASKMQNVQDEHGGKLDQEERGDEARVSGDDGQSTPACIATRHAFRARRRSRIGAEGVYSANTISVSNLCRPILVKLYKVRDRSTETV